MNKRWCIKKLTPQAIEAAKRFNLTPITTQILFNRQVEEDNFLSFLNPSLSSLHSPSLLPDIDLAYERIQQAIKKGEKIFLVGDYDVDGITSLAIFYEYIKPAGGKFSIYIPHRVKEGYGLNKETVKFAQREGASLLICFDCGTNSLEEIEFAKSLGIETIVVDHHQPKEGRNKPLAFINPKAKRSKYPFKELSSGGITFKLVQALKGSNCWDLLDLVALSVICDIVPLQGENRILAREGLKWLRKSERPAIKILCESSGVKQENLDVYHIGYILGPRINASGRVAEAQESLAIFLTPDTNSIKNRVGRLQRYNTQRKEIERFILKEAETKAEFYLQNDYVLIVEGDNWHEGVLGIVASRLTQKYHRPTFVIGFKGEKGKGSGRSITKFNLVEALNKCQSYLLSFGGHRKAAGIEILRNNIENFRKEMNIIAKKNLSASDLVPNLDIDLELKLENINSQLLEELEKLKPFGEENPTPLFLTKGLSLKQPPTKINGGLFSLWLSDGRFTYEGKFYESNGFRDILTYGKEFHIVYTLEKNRYYNTPRLVIRDVRLA